MHTKKAYGVRRGTFHQFLTLTLDNGDLPASRSDQFTAGKKAHNTHRTGGWVGPRIVQP